MPTGKKFRLGAPSVIRPSATAPLATPLPETPLRVTLLLASALAREIAPRASSLPNQEAVHPSHAPRLPVARRIFPPSCTRARPANPQQFQNPAKQARCSSHSAAHIETEWPADAASCRVQCALEIKDAPRASAFEQHSSARANTASNGTGIARSTNSGWFSDDALSDRSAKSIRS